MAETSGYTVRQLLPASFNRIDDAMEQARKSDPAFKDKKLPGVALAVAGERATTAVRDALNFDVFELMAQAWAKALEFKQAADDAEKSADKTATLFLGHHELSAEVHPVAELTFGVLGTLALRFTLEFTAKLDAAEVTIVNRAITRIGKTEGKVTAVLKYGAIQLHHPLESKKIPLHEDLILKRPVPLPL